MISSFVLRLDISSAASKRSFHYPLPNLPQETPTMLSAMGLNCICLDADGCCRRGSGSSSNPLPPPRELIEELHRLHRLGMTLAIVSGQPNCNVRVMEEQIGLDMRLVLPDYGAVAMERLASGKMKKHILMSNEELATMARFKPALTALLSKFKGYPDCRQSYIDTFFFTDEDQRRIAPQFFAAQDSVRVLLRKFPDAEQFLQLQWHRSDFSLNVAPKSVSKGGALQRLGVNVKVAAGDSSTDISMLELAEFPIVTFDEGDKPNPSLVKIVERKGMGYVCTRHHGFGLVDGLRNAAAAGMFVPGNLVSFPSPKVGSETA